MPALLHDFPLTDRNTLGFNVSAHLATPIRTASDVPEAFAHARHHGVPALVLGGGSNIVLTGDYPGLMLLMEIPGKACVAADDEAVIVEAAAGENWHAFVEWTLQQGWPGLENLALIPGTVGAAPVQNIGAYGLELADRFHSLDAWDRERAAPVTLTTADCAFAYRDSVFKRSGGRYVITAVRFRLPRRWQPNTGYADLGRELDARGIAAPSPLDVFDAVVAVRQRKLPDPAILGNVGSFFHNPVVDADRHAELKARFPELVSYAQADDRFKLAAGWLIDQCGFKGLRDGHVGVHDRQALVLVHHGGGTGDELLRLAQRISGTVLERYGVMLQPEPLVV